MGGYTIEWSTPGAKKVHDESAKMFKGSLDGNGFEITFANLTGENDVALFAYTSYSKVFNLTLNVDINTTGAAGALTILSIMDEFTDITVNGNIVTSDIAGGLVGWAVYSGTTFTRVTNNVDITNIGNTSYNIVGGIAAQAGTTGWYDSYLPNGDVVTFIDSTNNGKLTHAPTDPNATGYSIIGYVFGQVGNSSGNGGKAYITNFVIGEEAEIVGYTSNTTKYFEGYNLKTESLTYTTTPNLYKQFIGGTTQNETYVDGVLVKTGKTPFANGN